MDRRNRKRGLMHMASRSVIVCVTIVFSACSSSPTVLTGNVDVVRALAVQASVQKVGTTPTSVEVIARVTNTAANSVQFATLGPCPLRLRAYTTAARNGTPAWDESKQVVCGLSQAEVSLDPGGSQVFTRAIDASSIPLSPGTYYLTGILIVNDTTKIVDAGTLVL